MVQARHITELIFKILVELILYADFMNKMYIGVVFAKLSVTGHRIYCLNWLMKYVVWSWFILNQIGQ